MKNKMFTLSAMMLAAGLLGYGQGTITLTVEQAAPLKADAGADATIGKGTSATLGGNPSALEGYGSYTYLWSPATGLDNPALANPVATPTETTTYLLTVTDAQNCSATDEMTLTVDASGVETIPSALQVRCYPNPVEGDLLVELSGMPSEVTLRMISPLGTELVFRVLEMTGPKFIEQIPMKDLPAGIYYLQVITPENTAYRPILKTRQP